jgi:sugar phosphate isomerase/epimerase
MTNRSEDHQMRTKNRTGFPRRLLFAAPALLPAAAATKPSALRVGVATYSLRKFPRAQAISMLRELGVRTLSVKEFHLPYRDSAEALAAGRREFDQAGLELASGGVVVTYREEDSMLRRYFEYGRTCRFPMLIMMPSARQLPLIEKLAAEFDIRVAIHNHGPEDKNFPTPESVYEAIQGIDRRIGVCIDVGHSARAGVDVVRSIQTCRSRLVDVHIKDLRALSGHTDCEVGRGVLPIPAILRALVAAQYAGCINLEYEAEPENPVAGMHSSLAYIRGVLAGIEASL